MRAAKWLRVEIFAVQTRHEFGPQSSCNSGIRERTLQSVLRPPHVCCAILKALPA